MRPAKAVVRPAAVAAVLVGLLVAAHPAVGDDDRPSPNVVLIFCDDLGYSDIGCFGAEGYGTPNIDRLAAEGRRFTNFHVSQAVCSASRAALLTGCYSNRIGIHGALGPGSRIGLAAGERTMAEVFRDRGYATAIFGKWHLGHHAEFLPLRHGFDEFFGLPYSNDMWPFHPEYVDLPPDAAGRKRGFPDLPLIEGERIVNPAVMPEDQEQLTAWYTERAVDFIDRHHDRPFFLYVPHSMPHVPLFVSDRFRGKTERGLFGDVIAEIDWSVGEILQAVKNNGLEERTLVIFTSDNGPWLSYGDHAGLAAPLREGKGTSWEGGVRVPCVMRWPGRIPAGTECAEPIMTIDLLPTLSAIIGGKLAVHAIDGMDVWPVLAGDDGAKSPQEAYYIYYADNELQAVISGDWKLVFPHRYRTMAGRPGGTGGSPAAYSQAESRLELYNIVHDVGESRDVADGNPDVVMRLEALAEKARAELGDSLTKRKGTGLRNPGRLPDGGD